MNALFLKRRQQFQKLCARYLKYVFNDHFILFLMLGVGFLMIQYSQLIQNPPESSVIGVALVVLLLVTSPMGNFNAYLEQPDQHFLLAKEKDIVAEIKQAKTRGLMVWSVLQVLVLAFLYPLARVLDWSPVLYLVLGLGSLIIKWVVFELRAKTLMSQSGLDWGIAVDHDRQQKQTVLKFFSLFTQVKGVSQGMKRRAYLDGLLTLFPRGTWQYLYARAFLRSGDYLSLSLRLVLLSLLSLMFINQDVVATVIVLLLNYLLLFQLIALYRHYDYQYMTRLYPLPLTEKKQSLRTFLNRVFFMLLAIQVVLAAIFFQDKGHLLILVGVQVILNLFYLPYKIEKLID
ncbi:ABC transporter permease [Streptococcus moroccensis]|uniref:ABC-2 type transport system permease protein n=1 Tax=Streptococcus moroccensis TaxID=1451356 RepID=A0ABT9YTK4_9STRE|nr:ABC transporter permease [Streptococcus moroccensis]MDQ0223095.1 ABC-2 type transport system permease protein [Streptococcus moroccensis]